jgi:glycyl-tRNA synthetase beta chain
VEWPAVLEGAFHERFLELPRDVVITAMQSHQRYFPLEGSRFAFVSNGGDPDVVRAGNTQVLENRLDDAAFSYERDVRVGIDGLAARLGSITFFEGGGTFADKAERLAKLVERLGGGEATLEAARLAKADQASELVREFTELEGRIGAEYARLAGYPEAVCAAIEEQYLPDAAGGALPATEGGRLLSAADKIDTLVVAFSLGHRPTGSRDPFGLRRAAIGLCRLAAEGGLAIRRAELEEPREFVEERYEALLDLPVEFVRAARGSSVEELGQLAKLAQALADLDDETLDLLHTAYTRADRLAQRASGEAGSEVDPDLLSDAAEVELARALEEVGPRIQAALSDPDAALRISAELAEPVDRFFEEVLVMAEDSAVRANRLRLLVEVRETLRAVGDFAEIPR